MINPKRHYVLNDYQYTGGPVLYWMNRDMRMEDNWALLYAQDIALQHKVPLFVVYNLDPHFLGGGERQYNFKKTYLKKVAHNLAQKNIHFEILEGNSTQKDIVEFIEKHKVGYMVTDFSPLRIQKEWLKYILKHIIIPATMVDAHNVVPVWVASPKQEFAARTFRPKVTKLLPEFLTDFPKVKKHAFVYTQKNIDTNSKLVLEKSIDPYKIMNTFLEERLLSYDTDRNDPNTDGQSNLSLFLHYGIISAQRVAYQASLKKDSEVFLEELIVRRELAENFCYYNPNYDNFLGLADWAQKTLNARRSDKREYVYTKKQFEKAQTHDDLWNAAQKELVMTGKMHGYIRMYWAKKILEWSATPEEAIEIAVYLNDKYELDGRDPNGYVGVLWSIGGLHDRAWFNRPIFGLVRYMARSGCDKKFDTKKYIQKYL